ncbi:MAG: YceI family protein [Euzebyales bacterium]|jgi:polyisoprenoid-binding protein YceI|nr:YceI family protein [Euzebyales bacterium]
MRKLLRALLGITVPIALCLGVIYVAIPRPAEVESAAGLGDATELEGGAGTTLVGSPDGTWTATEGWVGYRVIEDYARLSDTVEGYGRTEAVSAGMVIDNLTVTSLQATADLTRLRSERDLRDRAIRVRYLETDTHPEAAFGLTEPVPLDPLPQPGVVTDFTVAGELELRGITRGVTVELQARWDGDDIHVVGSAPVRLSAFDIERPDIAAYVEVSDDAIFEFELTFTRD